MFYAFERHPFKKKKVWTMMIRQKLLKYILFVGNVSWSLYDLEGGSSTLIDSNFRPFLI